MRFAVLALLLACARAPSLEEEQEQDLDGGCGSERWLIKTASDQNAIHISTVPVATTIAALVAFPAQKGNDLDRIAPTELTTYRLTDVDLVQYRREGDSDYHLVLGDGTRTMIAELPDPGCVAPTSPLRAAIQAARSLFDERYAPVGPTAVGVGAVVTVTGVGFFDEFHSQTGVAANAIELHPVTSICFGRGCADTVTMPPPLQEKRGCTSAGDATWLLLLPFLRRRRATA